MSTIHRSNATFAVDVLRETTRRQELSVFQVDASSVSLTNPFSGNLLVGAGRLLTFDCDVILSGSSQIDATKTRFFDTSGTPTGTEPELFQMLSLARKDSGITLGFSGHSFHWPELGIKFENGIGVICTSIAGTNTVLEQVAATGTYIPEENVPP